MIRIPLSRVLSITAILISAYILPFYFPRHLLAADLPKKQVFETKDFSISVDIKKWKLIKQKQTNPAEDPDYIETDLGNALSDPIIGKGAERVLFVPEEELSFAGREKKELFVTCMPLGLWQITEKTKEQVADSVRDAFLLMYSKQSDIKNSDIKYFDKTISDKRFFGVFYNFEGAASSGIPAYTMHFLYLYLPEDLRKKYWFMVSIYDNKSSADNSVINTALQDLLRSFKVAIIDEKQDYLNYVLYSAQSLYIHLRQRTMYEEIDKQPLSIYKVPINIEQNGITKRRILNSDHLDIRKHPIRERINQTIILFKEAADKFPVEPRIHFGLGLLYEFNSFGERYGEGFNQHLAIASYQKALSINPKFNPARYNLAVLYLRKGDFDVSINELEKIITGKSGQDWEAYSALAYAYEKKSNLASSANYYKLALANLTAEQKRTAPELIKHLKDKIKH